MIDDCRERKNVLALRNDGLPTFFGRITDVDRDDSAARRVQIGLEIERRADVVDEAVARIGGIQETRKLSFLRPAARGGAANFPVIESVVWACSLGDGDAQVLAVVGDEGFEVELDVVRSFEHQGVFALRSAERVPIDLRMAVLFIGRNRAGLRIAIVVEAGIIVFPGDAREFGPLDKILAILAAVDFPHVNLLSIAAALG